LTVLTLRVQCRRVRPVRCVVHVRTERAVARRARTALVHGARGLHAGGALDSVCAARNHRRPLRPVAAIPGHGASRHGNAAFTSCSAATLSFAFTSGSNAGQAGSIALSRWGQRPRDAFA